MRGRLALAVLTMASACALIDAARTDVTVPLACIDDPNGCVCDVVVPPVAASGTCTTKTPIAGAICCVDTTGKCACALPACFDDPAGNCLCGVFADPASFGFTPAADNRCPASADSPVCCETFTTDFPSCQCGPTCSQTESNIGAVCLPSHVNNCGALTQVDACQ